MENLIFNIVFMPLFGAILAFFLGRKINDRFAQIISSIFIIASFVFSLIIFKISVFDKVIFNVHLLDWINIGSFKASWSLYVDSVTAVMFIVVTSVSSVVHLYSIGYMEDDESIPRFMSYLSLFTFFMLLLVSANNILQLFVGWEGVGLCSYLLIGFWYKKTSANQASMKAFLVNRVSDFAFILGIASLFFICNNVNYQDIFAQALTLQEKDATYVNLEGRVQRTKKAVAAPKMAEEDFMIIVKIAKMLDLDLGYKNLKEIRARIAKDFPHFSYVGRVIKSQYIQGSDVVNCKTKTIDYIDNSYFLTDPISRASVTMAKSVKAFEKGDCSCS